MFTCEWVSCESDIPLFANQWTLLLIVVKTGELQGERLVDERHSAHAVLPDAHGGIRRRVRGSLISFTYAATWL
jgi:hypothetical protein